MFSLTASNLEASSHSAAAHASVPDLSPHVAVDEVR